MAYMTGYGIFFLESIAKTLRTLRHQSFCKKSRNRLQSLLLRKRIRKQIKGYFLWFSVEDSIIVSVLNPQFSIHDETIASYYLKEC